MTDLLDRLYSSKFNPLRHSGQLALLALALTLPTGVYMLCFYRVGDPYQSVQALHGQVWLGRWIQALHRYSADAALVFAAVHALRMAWRHKTRALPWLTGIAAVGAVLATGWTGLVLVWDRQGQLFATEGVRFIDMLPLFSEPIGRLFTGERPLPQSFFFMNLFLHVALPLGVGVLMWLHTSRVARPRLAGSRELTRAFVALMVAGSVLWPLHLLPAADTTALPGRVPLDLFYGFWMVTPTWLWVAAGAVAASVPLWWRAPRTKPSVVDEKVCTGCTQCYQDCPYDAIRMVDRTEPSRWKTQVAVVDPSLCLSCGICAGSCGPMVVGPPGRAGRDQMVGLEGFLAGGVPEVLVFACGYGLRMSPLPGVRVFPVSCAGSLHTSVLEQALRRGVGGVLVLSCPREDPLHREGPKWLFERVFAGREADLKERVDRRRVRVVATSDATEAERAARELLTVVRGLAADSGAGEVEMECAHA